MQNDETIGLIAKAIQDSEDGVAFSSGILGQAASAIAAILARAKEETDRAAGRQLQLNQIINEAKVSADAAFAGSTTDMAQEAMSFLIQAEQDSTDNVGKLRTINDQLDRLAREIVPIYVEENARVAVKLRSAVGYLRGYANNL